MTETEVETTLVELKAMAVELGIDEVVANSFKTKAQLLMIIDLKKTSISEENKPKLVDQSKSGIETPKEKFNADKEWLNKRDIMGRHLESQPKVGMAIQLEPGEKEGIVESRVVNGIREFKVISGAVKEKIINGYKWILPKGVMTQVPEQVYELLSNELNIMARIGSKQSIERIDPQTGRRVGDML